MFSGFFYLLRARGVKVTPGEWLELLTALDRGMCRSLTELYSLSRMLLVKSEADFEKFDAAFAEFFHDIKAPLSPSDELFSWLMDKAELTATEDSPLGKTNEQIYEDYLKRLAEQKERHDEGGYFIGQGGYTAFGNAGKYKKGMRVGGESGYRTAFTVIDSHEYSDFRETETLGVRQYQTALKTLRRLSENLPVPETELDIKRTIDDTSKNGGFLTIRMKKPRENTVRLLLLMDSGGSMYDHAALCSSLFTAVEKSNSFRDVKIYYFHNCIYSHLYTQPSCSASCAVETERVLKNYDGRYKLVLVGDAAMEITELTAPRTDTGGIRLGLSGLEWLGVLRHKYPSAVWLNPKLSGERRYKPESEELIERVFPMYKLSVDGLREAIGTLIGVRRRKGV